LGVAIPKINRFIAINCAMTTQLETEIRWKWNRGRELAILVAYGTGVRRWIRTAAERMKPEEWWRVG
jgi:hypothetical protein